ncbi:hypothetical protein A9K97_gp125 [Tokyovirus A1]|uniref:hypothetical protein n=1 Tax=Tokyovirus A1 TaxID=1826170 RepID=UPI0007A974CC|nr:hypothetical protein A9K97_gp125 [Tokyovirus A1]BAU80226.1 hypothetical protein [Tokyovirus A1]
MLRCASFFQRFGFVARSEYCDTLSDEVECFCCVCGKGALQKMECPSLCENCGSVPEFSDSELKELVEEGGCVFVSRELEMLKYICDCGHAAESKILEFLSGRKCENCSEKDDAGCSCVGAVSRLWFGCKLPKPQAEVAKKGIRYSFAGKEREWFPDVLDEAERVCISVSTDAWFRQNKTEMYEKLWASARLGYNTKMVVCTEEGEEKYSLEFPCFL